MVPRRDWASRFISRTTSLSLKTRVSTYVYSCSLGVDMKKQI